MVLARRVTDLPPYDLLISIATAGSMTRAAAAHGISQAAVSQRLQKLESALGIRLLDRSSRGTTLTGEGALVAEWAARVIEAAHSLDDGVSSLQNRTRAGS